MDKKDNFPSKDPLGAGVFMLKAFTQKINTSLQSLNCAM
jgi:hypothetical protein